MRDFPAEGRHLLLDTPPPFQALLGHLNAKLQDTQTSGGFIENALSALVDVRAVLPASTFRLGDGLGTPFVKVYVTRGTLQNQLSFSHDGLLRIGLKIVNTLVDNSRMSEKSQLLRRRKISCQRRGQICGWVS